jgi:hypothetical protein
MKDTECMDEFLKLNNPILLFIEQIKNPIKKEVLTIWSLEQRQSKLFLGNQKYQISS